MLRRAASGHIEATQLPKFAAASRIALAVIRGWPEAPSSPLQGKAALLPLAAGAGWFAFVGPERMLLRKFSGPPPLEDCACASPAQSNAAASSAVAARLFAENPVDLVMSYPCRIPGPPLLGGLATVSTSLTKPGFWWRNSSPFGPIAPGTTYPPLFAPQKPATN